MEKLNKLNTTITLLFSFFVVANLFAQPAPPPGKKWEVVPQMTDEFNSGFNNNKWSKPLWNYGVPVQMRAQNSGVSNGKLWIKATLDNGSARWFETSRVMSKAQIKFPMYTECSMKTAHISAYNTFWTNNGDINNRDEIDIVENNSNPSIKSQTYRPYTMYSQYFLTVNRNDERAHGNFDNRKLSPNNPKRGKKWNEVYHTVGMWWKDDRTVQFYLDGEPAGSIKTTNRRFTRNQNLIWDLWTKDVPWLGGLAVKSDLNNNSINTMYVDWVHTYRLVNGQAPPAPKPPVVTPKPPVATPNTKPNVNFAEPSNNTTVKAGSNIAVTVNASDNDGIANVKLYLNNKLVRQENVSPYNWGANDNVLKNLKAGTYTLKAVATDKKGLSNETQITVRVNAESTPNPIPVDNSQLIANGLYKIKNPFNNQNLLSRAAENYNAQMVNDGNYTDQQWNIKHLGNNVYTIQNSRNNRYLEVPNGRCANAANVATWTNSNGDHKKWKAVKVGNYYAFRPMHCQAQALDRAGGLKDANMITWAFNAKNNNQKWELVPTTRGLKVLADNSKIIVAPNPAKDFVEISGLPENAAIEITNMLGQSLINFTVTSTTELINVESFADGVYFIRINNEISKKLIINK